MRKLSVCCLITISVISFTNCWAEIPPKIFSPVCPDKLSRRMAANRTRKNSSKLLENIPRKRSLSSKGTVGSAASCNTRALKVSQLFSRSMNLFFLSFIMLINLWVFENERFFLFEFGSNFRSQTQSLPNRKWEHFQYNGPQIY